MLFVFALSWLLLLAGPASAVTVKYCSSVNTGSSNSPDHNTYQSIGRCRQQCTDDYAFGILQGKSCWCSNVAPNDDSNVDTSKCDDSCPGYPDDTCGNESEGLFGYIMMMDHMASSTASASSTSGTSTGTSSETSDTTTTTSGDGAVAVHTVAGQAHTVTVGQSEATAAADTSSATTSSGSGLSKGAVAGVAVGSVAGVGALLALLLIWVCAKRRQNNQNQQSPNPSLQNTLVDGRHSKGSQMSFMKGMFPDNTSHTLSAGSSNGPTRMPTFTDNRMKPDTGLYQNGNRDSSVSLQDNEDYSRPVLRLTNPD